MSLTLIGCGGSNPDYGTKPAPGYVPAAGIAPPRFAYVVNSNTNNVSGYSVNASTGALTLITGSPWTAGTSPQSISVDPTVQFAYVVNAGTSGGNGSISSYTVGSNGALTGIGGTPPPTIATGPTPKGVGVDPLGRYIYVVNTGDNTISGYARNSTTGVLTALSPATVSSGGVNPQSITIDPSGKFAYVANFGTGANSGNGSVSVFTISTTSGTAGQLIPGTAITSNVTAPQSIAISPSGAYAYVANFGGDSVSVFDINATTGALSYKTVVASPPGGGTSPTSVAVEPNGLYAYVSNIALPSPGNVVAYQINQTGSATTKGSLTALSGTGAVSTLNSGGGLPYSVTADPSGKYVYAVQSSGGIINPFQIGSTGALTALTAVTPQSGTDGAVFILITK